MGKPSVTEAVGYLTAKGFRAARGYPNAPAPRITAPAVAVNVHKAENTAATYCALVCVPQKMGAKGCEETADAVAAAWIEQGAECSWGECRSDDTLDVFAIAVYGRWEDPPEEESPSEEDETPVVPDPPLVT